MADTTNLKTFELECPNCGEDFDHTVDPAILVEDGDPITCPMCAEECEWELDDETGELVLLSDDDLESDQDDEDEEDEEEDEDETT